MAEIRIREEAVKTSNTFGKFRPFKKLQTLLEEKDIKLKSMSIPELKESNAIASDHRPDQVIFEEAMAGVKKISRSNSAIARPDIKPQKSKVNVEYDSLAKLKELVKYGTGFVVSLTPEYIEGRANTASPEVTRLLHKGNFSVQAHIDLHGLGVMDAHQAFDRFLHESISDGKRTVLVIHGRGLSSPYEPVLKAKVYQWLTAAPWHKWVIAFTSARLCDGGTGATYILLRRQPLTKRFRKKITGKKTKSGI